MTEAIRLASGPSCVYSAPESVMTDEYVESGQTNLEINRHPAHLYEGGVESGQTDDVTSHDV